MSKSKQLDEFKQLPLSKWTPSYGYFTALGKAGFDYKFSFEMFAIDKHGVRIITTCIVGDKDGYPVARGAAIKVPSDKFNPDLGRRIALARALDDARVFGRSERKEVFRQYTSYQAQYKDKGEKSGRQ